jgi:hypothetical protein
MYYTHNILFTMSKIQIFASNAQRVYHVADSANTVHDVKDTNFCK